MYAIGRHLSRFFLFLSSTSGHFPQCVLGFGSKPPLCVAVTMGVRTRSLVDRTLPVRACGQWVDWSLQGRSAGPESPRCANGRVHCTGHAQKGQWCQLAPFPSCNISLDPPRLASKDQGGDTTFKDQQTALCWQEASSCSAALGWRAEWTSWFL